MAFVALLFVTSYACATAAAAAPASTVIELINSNPNLATFATLLALSGLNTTLGASFVGTVLGVRPLYLACTKPACYYVCCIFCSAR